MYAIYPAANYVAVTPSDTAKIQFDSRNVQARGLYIGVTGDVTVVGPDGTAVAFLGVPAGTVLPISTNQVKSTGTTATDIVALLDNNEQLN